MTIPETLASNPKLDPSKPPPTKPVDFAAVPHDLRAIPQWVVWGWVWNADKKKWDKPPRNVRTGQVASITDPNNYATFEEAVDAYERGGLDGIGIALTPELGLVGLDIDNCVDPQTRELTPEASEIVGLMGSYTEISPSGTGIRIFVYGRLPDGARRKGSFEVYSSGRYLTVTGEGLDDTPD